MRLYCALMAIIFWTLPVSLSAQTSEQAPTGTAVDKTQADAVQPIKPKVHLTPEVIRSAQEKLADAGYHPGKADGRLGPMTRAAIRKYQREQRLKVSGKLDESTLS